MFTLSVPEDIEDSTLIVADDVSDCISEPLDDLGMSKVEVRWQRVAKNEPRNCVARRRLTTSCSYFVRVRVVKSLASPVASLIRRHLNV